MRRSQPGIIVPTTVEFRMSLLGMRCKSLQRISSHAIPGTSARRLIGAAEESRCRERRIREVRRSRLPTWVTRSPAPSSPLAICGGTSRKKEEETLRPYIRAVSFVILLRPSSNLSRRSPSEVLPRLTSVIPDVLQVSIFTTLRRSGWHGWAKGAGWFKGNDGSRRTKTARSDDYDRRISSFMSALSLYSSRSFSSSPFFHAKTPRLISPARMTLRRQVVEDSEILPAGSTACTRNVLRV